MTQTHVFHAAICKRRNALLLPIKTLLKQSQNHKAHHIYSKTEEERGFTIWLLNKNQFATTIESPQTSSYEQAGKEGGESIWILKFN